MAVSGSFLPVRRHRRDLVFLLVVAVSVALLGDGPTTVKPAYPSSNNLPLPDLAEPDHSLSLASCRGVRMDPMSANLACSFPSNKIPCFRSVLALPVLLPSKSPWPAFFLCFRSDACSCCLVRAGQLRIGACFLGMFWHRFFRFGDIFLYISMHQTETVLRWNHLLSLLPFPGARCWLLAHVLHPISWRQHIRRLHPRRGGSCIAREPRGAVRVRRRLLAVSPSCWWQLERQPVALAWPAPVSSGDVEAVPKLVETPVLKTDAWIVHRRWVVYVSLLDNIVIFISRIAYVVWDFYVLFLYYDLFYYIMQGA